MALKLKDLPESVQAYIAKQDAAKPADWSKMKPACQPPAERQPSYTPGRMNKTEARLDMALQVRMRSGEFLQVGFEALTFRLGFDCRFTPDFACWTPGGRLMCFECKGRKGKTYFAKDDAVVKLKTAAAMYPYVKFFIVWPVGDCWGQKEIRT